MDADAGRYSLVTDSTATFCVSPMCSPTAPYGPLVVGDWLLLPWRQQRQCRRGREAIVPQTGCKRGETECYEGWSSRGPMAWP